MRSSLPAGVATWMAESAGSVSLQPSSASNAPSGDQASGLRFRSLSSGRASDVGSEPSGAMTVLVHRPSARCWVIAIRSPSGAQTPQEDDAEPIWITSPPSGRIVNTCSGPPGGWKA